MGKDIKELTLATLQKDKVETVALDIYINVSQNVTLTVVGGDLHLSGFYEPQRDEMDENMFLEGEDEDEDEEEEVVTAGGAKLTQSLKAAKANALKNAKAAMEDDEDEDDDEDLEEYDDEDDEDEDSEEDPKSLAKKPVVA